MRFKEEIAARRTLVWGTVAVAIGVPIALAATSPLLAWRSPIYIAAGFSGVIALGLMLLQPMLIGGFLPGLPVHSARRVHRWIGAMLVTSVVVHVGGLWITSPPDVIDVLLFDSPTPFSKWGVIAMWALFATAFLAALRRRFRLGPHNWSIAHRLLAVVIVVGTVGHAILIEGTMETISKVTLCVLVLGLSMNIIFGPKFWSDLAIWVKRKL